MPPFVLTVLKFAFLALLYFFVYRAIRVGIWEVAGRRPPRSESSQAPAPRPQRSRKGREPTSLVVLDGDGKKVSTHRLSGTVQVGRAEACQVRLDDTYVSQFHARIFNKNDGWFVEDLGSTNGTYLNQRKVSSPMPLQAGDRLKIGRVLLELRR